MSHPAHARTALQRIALHAIASPRRFLVIAALVTIAAGLFGVPVAKTLCACGFEDPTSESAIATKVMTDKFGQGDSQLLIVVTSPDGYQSGPGARRRHRHRRPAEALAARGGRDVGVDRAARRPPPNCQARTAIPD